MADRGAVFADLPVREDVSVDEKCGRLEYLLKHPHAKGRESCIHLP